MHLRNYYGQRWQVETVNCMIKRNQSDVVLGHAAWSRNRELRLAVLTHNIAIVLVMWVPCGAYLNLFPATGSESCQIREAVGQGRRWPKG